MKDYQKIAVSKQQHFMCIDNIGNCTCVKTEVLLRRKGRISPTFYLFLKMIEKIEQLKEFPDYFISNYGYVISRKWGKQKILSVTRITSEGYPEVVLRLNGKSYPRTLHKLVMHTFGTIEDLPIDHIDENKVNPKFDNLRYLTDRDNLLRYHKKVKPNGEFRYSHINWISKAKTWRISVMEKGKRKIIGYHKDQEEAKKIQDIYLATNCKN